MKPLQPQRIAATTQQSIETHPERNFWYRKEIRKLTMRGPFIAHVGMQVCVSVVQLDGTRYLTYGYTENEALVTMYEYLYEHRSQQGGAR